MNPDRRRILRQTLRELLEPAVQRQGCELVAVDLAGDGRHTALRLYIDRPSGVGIDDCTRVSQVVSPLLDVEDPFPGAWTLEVSSPGIDRPVERPEDFARFRGYRAKVRMGPGGDRKTYTGRILGLEGDELCLELPAGPVRIPLDRVDRVRLDLTLEEFERLAATAAAEGSPAAQGAQP